MNPAVAALRLAKARVSLDAARLCLANGLWDDGVNRAAQAALMAGRAALMARGEERVLAEEIARALSDRPLEGVPDDAGAALVGLCDDAAVADRADSAAFDEDEAVRAVDLAERVVAAMARRVPEIEGDY